MKNGRPLEAAPAAGAAITPGAFRAAGAAAYCGMSEPTWHRLNAAGKVPSPIRLGGCVLWGRAELDAWLAAGCPDRATWDAIRARPK